MRIEGIVTALATPFLNQEVDFGSFDKLVATQVDAGVHGFVVGGTTAESPTLTEIEIQQLFERTRNLAGSDLSILVGTGSNSTTKTVQTTRHAAEWGARGALVVVPYYNKPPQRGLYSHFMSVADASPIPIVLYNVPGRTITALELETILKLAEHPNIVGIKEASGDLNLVRQLVAAQLKDFVLLSGDDATWGEFVAEGGQGVISVISHLLAEPMVKIWQSAKKGDLESAKGFQTKYADLLSGLYCEANPIPLKAALHFQGVFKTDEMRLPLMPLDENLHLELKKCLSAHGLL